MQDVIICFSLMVAIFSTPTHAVDCRDRKYKKWDEAFNAAKVVVEAIVTKGHKRHGEVTGTTTLDVQRSWKGSLGPGKITVVSKHDTCTPYPFTKGERYIVYMDYQSSWPKQVTILRAVNSAWAVSDEDRKNLPEKLRRDIDVENK